MAVPMLRPDEAVALWDVARDEGVAERGAREIEVEGEPSAHHVDQVMRFPYAGHAFPDVVHLLRGARIVPLDLVRAGYDELLEGDEAVQVRREEIGRDAREDFLVISHGGLDLLFHDNAGDRQRSPGHVPRRRTPLIWYFLWCDPIAEGWGADLDLRGRLFQQFHDVLPPDVLAVLRLRRVVEHNKQEGDAAPTGLRPGRLHMTQPPVVPLLPDRLLHPHPRPAGAAAEPAVPVLLHLDVHDVELQQHVPRLLDDPVVPRQVTGVMVRHRLAQPLCRPDSPLVHELLEELRVVDHLELPAELRVLVEDRVEAVPAPL